MKGGGAAVSIAKDERDRLLASVQPKWNAEMDATCGKEMGDKLRALLAKYANSMTTTSTGWVFTPPALMVTCYVLFFATLPTVSWLLILMIFSMRRKMPT